MYFESPQSLAGEGGDLGKAGPCLGPLFGSLGAWRRSDQVLGAKSSLTLWGSAFDPKSVVLRFGLYCRFTFVCSDTPRRLKGASISLLWRLRMLVSMASVAAFILVAFVVGVLVLLLSV